MVQGKSEVLVVRAVAATWLLPSVVGWLTLPVVPLPLYEESASASPA